MKVKLVLESKESKTGGALMRLLREFLQAGNTHAITDFKVVDWKIIEKDKVAKDGR